MHRWGGIESSDTTYDSANCFPRIEDSRADPQSHTADRPPGTNAGWPLTASDQIVRAIADLWDDGPRAGLSREDIAAIVNRYLVYRSGEPWPRKRAWPGVVPLHG
jgi:hypothetical protein